jgi:polar amino acid transport system substrate-binding protein
MTRYFQSILWRSDMKKLIFLAVLSLLLCTISFADEISLTADVWAPYTMDPQNGKDGYLIDLARAAFQLKGHSVKYSLRPYSRSILETQKGKCDGVVGIYRDDARNQGFIASENELGLSINAFFVRKDDTWQYDNSLKEKSLEGKKIGVIQDYIFDEIQGYLQANKDTPAVQYVAGENPLEKNLKKLLGKRIDITIDDEVVIQFTARKMGIDGSIRNAGRLSTQNPVVIGFSPKNPKSAEYDLILSQGVENLRKTGELDKILANYGMTDWKKK